jgi:pyruvate dehydrogenase E1 component alpha subunit
MQQYDLSRESMVEMFTVMTRIREFETKVLELYGQGKMHGLAHVYIGEEAVACGACAAITADDYIGSTHRGHGHVIAKGADTRKMMAELLGRRNGYCKGKGGSMHIVDAAKGILGANGVVGGGIPIATGAAYALRLKKTDKVVLSFFGDGASNQGTFHESLNMASAWKLPVIYVLENNLYGLSTAIDRVTNVSDLAVRAKAYGIEGVIVDGNDVTAVYAAVKKAVDLARSGGGPTLIECKTYRRYGHFTGDPATAYRSREEENEWRAKDPIPRFRQFLLEQKVATENELVGIEEAMHAEIAEATEYARNSPYPELSEAFDDVYYIPSAVGGK